MTSKLDVDLTRQVTTAGSDTAALFSEREPERYALHARHMNEMMVRVLRTVGFDIGFRRGTGQYLFDSAGQRYLDLLSGWGVFGIGRNHPKLREALTAVLAADFPNLVQMDAPPLAGILAERLLRHTPFLEKVFLTNSGAKLECAPGGGQNERFELTPLAGLPEDGSHDEASVAQRRVQAAGR